MIQDETIREVRACNDIVTVVGEYVDLRHVGGHFEGLCPFHAEKHASFRVDPEKQTFRCFGCDAHGDVIEFIMRYEQLTFPAAVQRLADHAGMKVHKAKPRRAASPSRSVSQDASRNKRLSAAMELAVKFYRQQLTGVGGKEARKYLEQRGVRRPAQAAFELGYASRANASLAHYLQQHDIAPADAEAAGLIMSRMDGKGHDDRFRERVIFPIRNEVGGAVALGGRLLPGAESKSCTLPKYRNSPSSPIFSRARTLYGLVKAKKAIEAGGTPIIVEGYLDVVSMHTFGLPTTVASMGTGLTEDQSTLLLQSTTPERPVVVLMDGDKAGRAAGVRACAVLYAAGFRLVVNASLPDGDDPDSFLRKHGCVALVRLMRAAPR